MRTPRQKIKTKLDKLFTQMVMFRDKRTCEKCGRSDTQMQTSHIVGRTNLHLRWNLNNAMCLCAYHHLHWWHAKPLEAAKWFQDKYPDRFHYLETENQKTVKYSTADLEEVYDGLKQIAVQTGVI
jgi:5-methylcytosine-specific restriction endonuclease McrA